MTDEKKTGRGQTFVRILFLTICALCCLIPLVGMLWAPTTTTTENRELAEVPVLVEDGELNTDWLSDWGTYFEDHFAYRNLLVSINAEIRATLLGVSATDSVIVGTEDWLYYSGTLSDYCGEDLLSTRGVDNIAFNLSIMQGYANAYGADFIVVFAPNKNSLYSENMPYYYTQGEERNLTAVEAALAEYGVNYVSMYEAFSEQDEVLYYLRDTHWNTKGAWFACLNLLSALGNDTAVSKLSGLEPVLVDDFTGDINSMLYPVTAEPETDYSYDADLEWSFLLGESVEDSEIITSGEGSGTLLMYRDSFANNMIAFLSDVYETAYFTKMVPYDLTEIGQYSADTVIIERAERHLSDLGTDPAIMPAPSVSLQITRDDSNTLESDGGENNGDEDDGDETVLEQETADEAGDESVDESGGNETGDETLSGLSAYLQIGTDGDYTVISGDLPESYWTQDAQIYVGLEKADGTITWYVPFHLTTDNGDYGFQAYFYPSTFAYTTAVWLACTTADGETVSLGWIDAN